jgi:hypothetical protein
VPSHRRGSVASQSAERRLARSRGSRSAQSPRSGSDARRPRTRLLEGPTLGSNDWDLACIYFAPTGVGLGLRSSSMDARTNSIDSRWASYGALGFSTG